ncbi:MAG: site-2 protease family protein [Oscillospiraceae bacterium]
MNEYLPYFARLAVILTAMPVHEFAHGYVATKLGDDTPRLSGRLTLNPMHHLDIVGTLMIMLFGIGFAKPVPVNPYNFNGNRKRGMAITALAGPVSNLLMAMVLMIIYKVMYYSLSVSGFVAGISAVYTLITLFSMMLSINISLAVFNLLPVYPLDGSRILAYFLPPHIERKIEENGQVINIVLFGLLLMGFLDKPIYFLSNYVFKGLDFLTGFVEIIFKTFL